LVKSVTSTKQKQLRRLEDAQWKQKKYIQQLEHRMQELSDKLEQANVVAVSRQVTHSEKPHYLFFLALT